MGATDVVWGLAAPDRWQRAHVGDSRRPVPAAEQGAQRLLPYPITKATGRVEPSLLVTAAAWGITVVLLLYGWAAGEFAVSLVSPWAPLEGFELIATD